jgi:hypothetical protein
MSSWTWLSILASYSRDTIKTVAKDLLTPWCVSIIAAGLSFFLSLSLSLLASWFADSQFAKNGVKRHPWQQTTEQDKTGESPEIIEDEPTQNQRVTLDLYLWSCLLWPDNRNRCLCWS